MVRQLVKIIIAAALIYAAYLGLMFLAQRQVIFPRYMIPPAPQTDLARAGIDLIWLETSFGKVEAWYLPPAVSSPGRKSPAVIFGHGNGELIDYWPQELKGFTDMGVGLLLVEYPGYGRSAGSPSQASISETFLQAYDLLAARKDVDPSRIVLFGRSLGGGAVCDLALKRPSAALILMSCFTSVRAFTARYLAPGFLVRDPFDNLAAVRNYPGPVLVMHGEFDEIVPFSHGQALHAAARNAKMIAYEAGHNDCPPNWSIFWRDVEDFLRTAGVL
jgi:uncharacterized protein